MTVPRRPKTPDSKADTPPRAPDPEPRAEAVPAPDADEFLANLVADTIAPYRNTVPPEALRELEQLLGDVFATHPTFVELVARARPRVVLESGEKALQPGGAEQKGAGPETGAAPQAPARTGSKR